MSVLEKCHDGAVSGKKEKCHKGASCLFWRKVIMVLIWNSKSTIVTFLPEQSWRCFLHHYDFSHFLGPKLQRQFLGWKNAQIPQLIDSDGRALHKDSESGPNSKITKITNMTFLHNTAEISIPQLVGKSFTCCQGAADTLSWTGTRISLCWRAVRKAWSLAGLGLHRTFLVAQTPSTGDTFCLSPRCSHKQTLCEA